MAPPALVATVGAATSNTFSTLAEADLYMSARLNASDFTGATADDRNTALLEAARDLTRLPMWKGKRVDTTQLLSWPRDYVPDPDNPDNEGILVSGHDVEQEFTTVTYYATTIVPGRVKEAQAELALEYLRAGTLDVAGTDADRNIQEETVDVLTTRFFSPSNVAQGLARYPRVTTLIGPLVDIGPSKVVRG